MNRVADLEYESKRATRLVERARVHLTVWGYLLWIVGGVWGVATVAVVLGALVENVFRGDWGSLLVVVFAMGTVSLVLCVMGNVLLNSRREMEAGNMRGVMRAGSIMSSLVLVCAMMGILGGLPTFAVIEKVAWPMVLVVLGGGLSGFAMWARRALTAVVKEEKAREEEARGRD